MQFEKPELNGKKRRLKSALTIYDLKDIAKRRTPKAAFDYTDGAAEGELSLARARQAFEDVEFHPSILRDASKLDTTTKVLGGPEINDRNSGISGALQLDHQRVSLVGFGPLRMSDDQLHITDKTHPR